MSRTVLVIGKGKPHHIELTKAVELVCRGWAIWQKPGRRIKFIKGKSSRPKVRDLSCAIDEGMVTALLDRNHENHHLAKIFVNQTQRRRERAGA